MNFKQLSHEFLGHATPTATYLADISCERTRRCDPVLATITPRRLESNLPIEFAWNMEVLYLCNACFPLATVVLFVQIVATLRVTRICFLHGTYHQRYLSKFTITHRMKWKQLGLNVKLYRYIRKKRIYSKMNLLFWNTNPYGFDLCIDLNKIAQNVLYISREYLRLNRYRLMLFESYFIISQTKFIRRRTLKFSIK